ncbi:MAG: hypothetical protein ACI8Y4_003498 [Candidatus Poriferisodalaceae bacterium]|jgi:hypothetical protein
MALASVFALSGNWDHMNSWGGGCMLLSGFVMMALFAVLLVWMIRNSAGFGESPGPPPSRPADRRGRFSPSGTPREISRPGSIEKMSPVTIRPWRSTTASSPDPAVRT